MRTPIYALMSFQRFMTSPLVDTLALLEPLQCSNGITTGQDAQQILSNISRTAARARGARRLVQSLMDCSSPCLYPSDAGNISRWTSLPASPSPKGIMQSARLSTEPLRNVTTYHVIGVTKARLQKLLLGSLSGTSSDSTAYPNRSYQTEALNSSQSCGKPSARSSVSKPTCRQHITLRLMVSRSELIKMLSKACGCITTTCKTTGRSGSLWQSSLTTTMSLLPLT